MYTVLQRVCWPCGVVIRVNAMFLMVVSRCLPCITIVCKVSGSSTQSPDSCAIFAKEEMKEEKHKTKKRERRRWRRVFWGFKHKGPICVDNRREGSGKDWSDDYWRSKTRFSGAAMQRSGEDKRSRVQEERRQAL